MKKIEKANDKVSKLATLREKTGRSTRKAIKKNTPKRTVSNDGPGKGNKVELPPMRNGATYQKNGWSLTVIKDQGEGRFQVGTGKDKVTFKSLSAAASACSVADEGTASVNGRLYWGVCN